MREPFEIREFQSFVSEVSVIGRNLEESQFVRVPQPVFDALQSFVLENRSEDKDVPEFLTLGKKKGVVSINAQNYIGVITLKTGDSLQILPKLPVGNDEEGRKQEREIITKMLQSVIRLPLKEYNEAGLETKQMRIFEPLILMFANAAADLAKRGLRGAYVDHEENERFLKGKLVFSQHVKLNAAHAERFYVRYDEFEMNRPENRLIKTTLEYLRTMSRSLYTKRTIDTTLALFADIPSSGDINRDLADCMLDRTMGAYEQLIEWCSVFLGRKSFTSFHGNAVASSLLFPMEKLFESYVAQEVRRVVPTGWKTIIQGGGKHLYDDPGRFLLKPDIRLKKDGQQVILDTKWKALQLNPLNNFGISQSDMYQMYAYQKRFGASKAMLIYPRYGDFPKNWSFNYKSDCNALTQVFVFDLVDAKNSARELIKLATGAEL